MPPCPLSNKIKTRKQKDCCVNCCRLELLLGRGRVLAPGSTTLKSREAAALGGKVRRPIPSISSAPKTKHQEPQGGRDDRGERDIDGRFSHCLSFQFLYGECSPDPRRTKASSLSRSSCCAWRVYLVFSSSVSWLVSWLCNFCLDFQRYLADPCEVIE